MGKGRANLRFQIQAAATVPSFLRKQESIPRSARDWTPAFDEVTELTAFARCSNLKLAHYRKNV